MAEERVQGKAQERISVVRDHRLVPLFANPVTPRVQPWKGIVLERHRVEPRTEVPEHEHREFCLHLQVNGNAAFEWWSERQNRVEQTQPGSLILLPPGTQDRLLWHGRSERLILSIKREVLLDAESYGDRQEPPQQMLWSFRKETLRFLMTEMGREAAAEWPLGTLYANLLRLGVQQQILQLQSNGQALLAKLKGGLPLLRLRRAMEYITENLAADLSLEEIAREMDLSSFHFAHAFRASTGMTPYQYLLEQRMMRAKRLLRTSSKPVLEIAALTGFGSAVNFSRAFKQRAGMTPGEWRAESR